MGEYQAKARVAALAEQKLLFWKHVIITALICFSFCFALCQAKDYFSEHITIETQTDDNGDVLFDGNHIGGYYGQSEDNY